MMGGLCPNCGRNTVRSQTSDELGEEFIWCTNCHWEQDYTVWDDEKEDDDETEY